MRYVIVVRGQTGIVAWTRSFTDRHVVFWVCGRDNFAVSAPDTDASAEQTLRDIVTHSSTLVGAVQQIVQIQL
jgi:hypothetical protein